VFSFNSKMLRKKRYYFFACVFIAALIFMVDWIRITSYKTIPSLPQKRIRTCSEYILLQLSQNKDSIDWKLLDADFEYINNQYDVSDFDVTGLVRMLYYYPDKIPESVKEKIGSTLLKFRYRMDEPGENGMCYWSENHQILYAASEYLAGNLFPNKVFTNDGQTGLIHKQRASKRIYDWLEMRWKFGFSEFYSNVYYNEDIAGLINLIDFSDDSVMVNKCKMIMDLLLYDVASQKTGDMFISVSGRAYERNRKGGTHSSARNITNFIWHNVMPASPHLNLALATSLKYKTPQVIKEIGNDENTAVIKQCNGLNVTDLKKEGYYGSDERSMMMLWGMEAYTNPEIIRNSIAYIRQNKMFSNEFLAPFRYFDFTFLRLFGLEPFVSSYLNLQTNGHSIQRGNTYTYRTKNYALYSVQNYFPGNNADQVHVAGMNVDSTFSIFHSHPAEPDPSKSESPSYWVGYGRLPHVAQDSSVSLAIYNIPDGKNHYEKAMPGFTHAYFPKYKFDTSAIIGNYVFGRKKENYCVMIGRYNFHYRNKYSDDLIQPGRKVFWIIEASDKSREGSFKKFIERILHNRLTFDEKSLSLEYVSNHKKLELQFCGNFKVNGNKINTNYPRFDSPYVRAGNKPENIVFKFNGHYLNLKFKKNIREFN